ncbi:hypothetical protein RvY_13065 [Ramazzottius varieornatus]|uniref:Uncharacterized protein n=1 Tax=Ramazzottius varieornatus TaxID=947166 RepID=A0A1D1VRZ4_RAMVA|nr:hypothetical protein RvY_13065 [Ramazzottius varieornatus]
MCSGRILDEYIKNASNNTDCDEPAWDAAVLVRPEDCRKVKDAESLTKI